MLNTNATIDVLLEHFVFNGEDYDHIEEVYKSVDELFGRVNELWRCHNAINNDVGISVILTNRSGAELQVGVSPEGWLIIIEPKTDFQLVRKRPQGGTHSPFLLLSWTEFPSDCLHSPETAISLIREWLINDRLPLALHGLHIST